MKVMMLIAHGSRKPAANAEVERLARQIDALAGNDFDAALTAFLEFAEPDIPQGVARCAELGAEEILAVPYFLSAGNHVERDIPAQLEIARAEHPDIRIELCGHVGGRPAIAELVVQCARLV